MLQSAAHDVVRWGGGGGGDVVHSLRKARSSYMVFVAEGSSDELGDPRCSIGDKSADLVGHVNT